ncbi:MAG: amidohydrolase, partial [Rhodospirillales bacterium]|nr:amidohydrolase [Rhodospirillales bacterium]
MTEGKADLLLRGGPVFLGLEQGFAEALAIRGERVLAMGSRADLEGLVGPGTRVVELNGRAALPGFNDAHQHMLLFGLELTEVALQPSEVRTLAALQARIKARAEAEAPGEWVIGRRYDHFHLDIGRHPTAAELDAVAPDNPVWITRTCGHMGVANSRALALAGIDAATPDPPGGVIERRDGVLTGRLFENAQDLVKRVLPRHGRAAMVEALERAGRLFLSHGITSVMDAGVGLRQKFEDYLAYREARDQGRLPVRVYLSFTGGPGGIQPQAFEQGLVTGAGDEALKAGSVKLFADGSAGGKTAAMTLPYICSCGERGLFIYGDAELDAWVEGYQAQGYQISIHAIGDAAIGQALAALEKAMAAHPAADRRHRIEHCGFTTPEQIAAMGRLGVIPAPQPIFLYEFGDLYVDVLGEERPAASYPMRSWIDAGLRPIASSDTPVSDFDPMKNLYEMVTRRTSGGRVLGPGEVITLPEAV